MNHDDWDLAHPHTIRHPLLDEAYTWECHGNPTLLDEPYLLPCYINSQANEHDISTFIRLTITLAKAGWVLVGGFVSATERRLLSAVRQSTQPKVIQVAATRLHDEKPSANLAIDLHSKRFLRLTSAEEETCTRPNCVWHNLWAETLCGDWRADVETHFRTLQADETKIQKMMEFLRRWRSPLPSKYTGTRPLPGSTR